MSESQIELEEIPLTPSGLPISARAAEFLKDGRSRIKSVQCFDFVPSRYETAWAVLAGLPLGKLCEWGSGLGIVVGLAEMLGFQAHGVEVDADLAASSRSLLRDHGLLSNITTGNYLEIDCSADYYYVYCWPGQLLEVQQRFCQHAPTHAKLLACYGQEDIRCLVKREREATEEGMNHGYDG